MERRLVFRFVLAERRIFLKRMNTDKLRQARMAVRAVRARAASGHCFPRVLFARKCESGNALRLHENADRGMRSARYSEAALVLTTRTAIVACLGLSVFILFKKCVFHPERR